MECDTKSNGTPSKRPRVCDDDAAILELQPSSALGLSFRRPLPLLLSVRGRAEAEELDAAFARQFGCITNSTEKH